MTRRYVYPGACHCGNLEVRLESDRTPPELGLRTWTPVRSFTVHGGDNAPA